MRDLTTCERCSGLLLADVRRGWWTWRCLNCGNRLDHVIVRHRRWQMQAREQLLREQAARLNAEAVFAS